MRNPLASSFIGWVIRQCSSPIEIPTVEISEERFQRRMGEQALNYLNQFHGWDPGSPFSKSEIARKALDLVRVIHEERGGDAVMEAAGAAHLEGFDGLMRVLREDGTGTAGDE